jgi:hypothetical protein
VPDKRRDRKLARGIGLLVNSFHGPGLAGVQAGCPCEFVSEAIGSSVGRLHCFSLRFRSVFIHFSTPSVVSAGSERKSFIHFCTPVN